MRIMVLRYQQVKALFLVFFFFFEVHHAVCFVFLFESRFFLVEYH